MSILVAPKQVQASAFDTVVALQAATVASTVNAIRTHGYYAAGDGGGAEYSRVNSLTYPTYGLQSVDGAFWQYIPEAIGWNAKVAGVKADGVADDSVALQNALVPFNVPSFSNNTGQSKTGRLILPVGNINISQPVWYCGFASGSIHIIGQSCGSYGGGAGTAIVWTGSSANSWPNMFYLRGANRAIIEGINFKALNSVNLVNLLVVESDAISTTLSSGVTAGVGVTFTPASVAFIAVGTLLGIGQGTANFELVQVTATTGSTFTATCRNNHNSGETVGGSGGSSGVTIRDCKFNLADGAATAGIYCGNVFSGTTPQVSEVRILNCDFAPVSGGSGTAYAGINVLGSGNVENFKINENSFVGSQHAVIYNGGPTVEMFGNASGGITVSVVSGSFCHIDSWESEDPGAQFLVGTGGWATVMNCSLNETSIPTYLISFTSANLTLIGNTFGQTNGGGGGVAKIQAGGGPTITTGTNAYQITSINNFYQGGGTNIPVFFDGSNNALSWSSDFSSARKTRLFSVGDYGNFGQLFATIGQLSSIEGGVGLANLATGGTVNQANEIGETTTCVTVPFIAFQAAALTKQVVLFNIMPKTQIVSVIADVTTTFGGTAGTLTLTMESTATSVGGLLTAFDCKTAAIQKGLAATDLGADLTGAANLPPGGFFPSWASQTFVKSTLTSGTGNLSGLTQGSVNFYITVKRFNPS